MTVNSPYASPKATISRLAEWDLNTKKSLGQHFLIDDGVVGRILRIAELNEGEQVLEIGPGIGTLTEAMLLKGASVLAIEKDPRLVALLEETKQRYPKQFDYINADALEVIKATRPCHLEHSTAQPKDIVERLHNNQQMLSFFNKM